MPKLTKNQIAWNKEINRIQNFMKRAEKRGFKFDDFVLPKKPRRITSKAISELQAMTPSKLYTQAQYEVSPYKFISGTAGRKLERQRAASKGVITRAINRAKSKAGLSETSIVLSNVWNQINSFSPMWNWSEYFTKVKTQDVNDLVKILSDAISQNGADVTAMRLQNMASDYNSIIDRVMYNSDENTVNYELANLATILKGSSLTLEESQRLTESAETFDDIENEYR